MLCDSSANLNMKFTREHQNLALTPLRTQIFIADIVINFRSAWFVMGSRCLPAPPRASL